MNKFPKGDDAFEEVGIDSVKDEKSGWSITRSDGWSFFIGKEHGVEPKPGMTARFYGKGIGFAVRGIYRLSWKWVHGGGPASLVDAIKEKGQEDRLIQVSKSFPHAAV